MIVRVFLVADTVLVDSTLIGVSLDGTQTPVFYDSHSSQANNGGNVTTFTGTQGSGKTMATEGVMVADGYKRKTVFGICPKGDLASIAELNVQLGGHWVKDDAGTIMSRGPLGVVRVWDLSASESVGALDPMRLSDKREDQMELLVGMLQIIFDDGATLTRNVMAAVLAYAQDMLDREQYPSLTTLTRTLAHAPDESVRVIGKTLSAISQTSFGRVMFAPLGSTAKPAVSEASGTIIATMRGVALPADKPKNDEERVSVALLYVLAWYVRYLMFRLPVEVKKTLVIDEAHMVTKTEQGRDLIHSVARMGRSRNVALILASQRASDISLADSNGDGGIENAFAYRFQFRTDKKEAAQFVKSAGLPEGEGYDSAIASFPGGRGRCIMVDRFGKPAIIDVFVPQAWLDVFGTNPEEIRARRKRAASQAK